MADIPFKPLGHELEPLSQPWADLIKQDDKQVRQTLQQCVGKWANDFLPRVTNDQWQPCFAHCQGLDACQSKQCRRFREARDKPVAFDKLEFVAPELKRSAHCMESLRDIRRYSTRVEKTKHYLPDMSHISCNQLTVVAKLGALDMAYLPQGLTQLSLTLLRRYKTLALPDTVQTCTLSCGPYPNDRFKGPGNSYEEFYARNTQLVIGANLKKLVIVNLSNFDVCPINLQFKRPATQLIDLTLKSVFTNLVELLREAPQNMPNLEMLDLVPCCRGQHIPVLHLPPSLKHVTIYHSREIDEINYPSDLQSLHLRIDMGDAHLDQKVPQNCPGLTKLTLSGFMYDWGHTQFYRWPNYAYAQLRRILLPSLEELVTIGSSNWALLLYGKHDQLAPLPQDELMPLPNLKILRLWDASEFVTLSTTFQFDPNVLQQIVLRNTVFGHELEIKAALEAKDRQQLVNTELVYVSANCIGYEATRVEYELVTVK